MLFETISRALWFSTECRCTLGFAGGRLPIIAFPLAVLPENLACPQGIFNNDARTLTSRRRVRGEIGRRVSSASATTFLVCVPCHSRSVENDTWHGGDFNGIPGEQPRKKNQSCGRPSRLLENGSFRAGVGGLSLQTEVSTQKPKS